MPKEENLMILKMLQDGHITAEQAAELLNAIDASEARAAKTVAANPPAEPVAPAGVPPIPPVPSVPAIPPIPPIAMETEEGDGETFARARARIAAARERVAGVQEQLTAAEERMNKAEGSPNPWESVADALKDVPGARSISEALRGVDPGRIAAMARRQARRMSRSLRDSLDDLNIDININFAEQMQGEPTLTAPREATATILAGGTLRVKNTLGDIEAVGADVPEARVAGVLKIWAADQAAAEAIADQITLNIEQGSDGPTISVIHPVKIRRVGLDLKVFVPSGTRVSLLSPSGDITARGVKGGVVLATQSGDARASEIAGDVAAETASGDLTFEGILGNVMATTASGDVEAVRLSGQSFKVVTQSGDVSLRNATTPTLSVETVSGDIEVQEVSGRTLRVRSVSGDIQVTDAALEEETHLDTVSGSLLYLPRTPLQGGSINLSTVSGDIELKMPKTTDAQISISTTSGEMSGRFMGADKNDVEISKAGWLRARPNFPSIPATFIDNVGNGAGANITVSSVSGDIAINQDRQDIEIR